MGLILRVDVDKAYGRKNIFERIKSKIREDFWFPKIDLLGYLKATEELIAFCNLNTIRGVFYFRNCTIPNKKTIRLLQEGNHEIGFHAENTRSFETFKNELDKFKQRVSNLDISSFSKHGSGYFKIGRDHFAPYEPNKYKDWAKRINIRYLYGNAICDSKHDFEEIKDYYPKMFWFHKEYRNERLNKLEDVIKIARDYDVPVIIHPSNFIASKHVNQEFKKLVILAKQNSIPWKVL